MKKVTTTTTTGAGAIPEQPRDPTIGDIAAARKTTKIGRADRYDKTRSVENTAEVRTGQEVRALDVQPADYFDAQAKGPGFADGFRVVGSLGGGGPGSWGRTTLLEGGQRFLSEGYNSRTERLTMDTTFDSFQYPLKRFFGRGNQDIVDGFNLHYAKEPDPTGTASATKPEARFALLHEGPKTAAGEVDRSKRPVLLIHGAMQDANVWLWPAGYDGKGSYESPDKPVTGFVQSLEEKGVPTYAITLGNSHGSTLSHAVHVANAIKHLQNITGSDKVDVIAWSKGGLPVDLLLSNVGKWKNWGPDHFARVKEMQAKEVPEYNGGIGHYVSLGSPHGGMDLNFRHPFNNLVILSTDPAAPAGRGPVVWGQSKAVQAVTFGADFLAPFGIKNPYAQGVLEGRGGMWTDYWNDIHLSNIAGLSKDGKPLVSGSLQDLNVSEGASPRRYEFDAYNLAMWGSVDEQGRHVMPYAGQLELAYDYRGEYPVTEDPTGGKDNPDASKWYEWLKLKTGANVFMPLLPAGRVKTSLVDARNAAYDPDKTPVIAEHAYPAPGSRHKVIDGIGLETAARMGGNLVERLRKHSVSSEVDGVWVIHGGNDLKQGMFNLETDGPSDGVVFADSGGKASLDRMTRAWTAHQKRDKAHEKHFEAGHLALGTDPDVFKYISNALGI